MITISNFEKYVLPQILMRGEDYYESDAVLEIEEESPGEWIATVCGTENYEVTVSMEGNEIIAWECDCPYDGNICKHVVATLLAIRDSRGKAGRFLSAKEANTQLELLGKSMPRTVKDKEVEQILLFAESDKLSDFIQKYASSHSDFKSALLETFLPKRPAKKVDYRNEIESCFHSSYRKYFKKGRYYEPELDWNEVSDKVDGYLAKATLLFQREALEEVATIALQVLRSIGGNYIDEDFLYNDGDIDFGITCGNAGDLLLKVVQHSGASQALKKNVLNEIIQISKLATYREYEIFDMDELVQQIMLSVQSKEEALLSVNQLIKERAERWDLYKLVLRKIEILKELGKTTEVEATISEFLYLPEIRRQEVEKLLDEKCYEKAISMLNEGIVIAERGGNLGTLREWQEQLLSIYEEVHDVAKVIEMCRLLFIHTDGSLDYYHKLKSLIPSTDWKEYLSTLMQETTFYDYWGSGNNKADIYIEEKEYDKLFSFLSAVKYRRLGALVQYASHLNATHSSQILSLFTDDLRVYAEKNLGRNHYEYIARVLRGMRKLNGGKEAVKQLVEEFRVLYKRRPAMMQELGEF
ncbi:SWIM zinc finger family protein [Bacteroides sp.]|uniref:SWIM zinc finger family protein n=1 Tax=Bacteroides sp. TaxID=29523 RepID=UPI0025846900|nr:SWIM zinc finger family protein [Bacteroides sp.]